LGLNGGVEDRRWWRDGGHRGGGGCSNRR
jgi:hypothetical protein